MREVLTLKKRDKYISAGDLENLSDYVNRTFIIRKNNTVKAVKLVEVKNSKVYLEYTEERADKFSLPLNKFLKYYELPNKD